MSLKVCNKPTHSLLSYVTCGRPAVARWENIHTGVVLWRCREHDVEDTPKFDKAIYGRQELK